MIRAVGAQPAIGDHINFRPAKVHGYKLRRFNVDASDGMHSGAGHVLTAVQTDSDRIAIYDEARGNYQIYSLHENVCKSDLSREDAEAWVAGRLVVVSGHKAAVKTWVALLVVLLSSTISGVLFLWMARLLF